MQDFRRLKVSECAHQLVLRTYSETRCFPPAETYGLTSQIRRAAASIPANIAEGCGCSGDAELARFAQIAMGSASELEYHLLLARDLGFLSDAAHDTLLKELLQVKKMLSSLIVHLRKSAR